jgi:SNF2 family DNA or RNA helicase
MCRYERDKKAAKVIEKGKEVFPQRPKHKWLFEQEWNTITVDEAHKTGVANPDSLMARGFRNLKCKRLWFMTATPMGGKPLRLWGYLNQIEPETYTSKWAWAERWLTIEEVITGPDESAQSVGKVREDLEDDFARSLQPVMVRRLRRDHMDDLPQEEHIEVLCSMTEKQKDQYERFAADAEIRIEEERLSATGVLAEYARLKQFANAACYIEKFYKLNKATNEHEEKIAVIPTPDSGKLEFLVERLDENGIRAEDPEPGARAIVGSESRRMVDMVCNWLNEQGIKADRIHGGVKGKDRTDAVMRFKNNETQVLVIATTAGGVSLNLEEANSVHILDETWNPDDQEQLWGRGDRGTRKDSLLVYWYRTRGTIQHYIHDVTGGKEITNRNILDVRRELLNKKGE